MPPTRLYHALSRFVGWAADRRIPGPLREPIYRGYALLTGANLAETRPPLSGYASLGAFFVRRLINGARTINPDQGLMVSPVDGAVQHIGPIEGTSMLQAKGHAYSVRDLLDGVGADVDLDGGQAWTLYLSPKDYHRIHAPEAGKLTEVRWVSGARYSVNPAVLARRIVFPINDRCCLRLETERGPILMVFVGAVNVGRIRVVGVEPQEGPQLDKPRTYERGEELGRFEMGSTVILVTPPGFAAPSPTLAPHSSVRLGQSIGRYLR